jgi:GNAT superfamily N-acetyltransferase
MPASGLPRSALRIPVADTYPLRLLVLRPGGTLADAQWADDAIPGAFHAGVRHGHAVVCVGSFHPQAHAALPANSPWRLRGMATHPAHRGTGAGEALLRFALAELRHEGAGLLWCHARRSAMGFYQRLGFIVHGPEFEVPGIGPHVLMSRAVD